MNHNFKLEYLPSKVLGHADGLSRLIPKYRESLEDTEIAVLRAKNKIKNILWNVMHELPETLG